MNADLVTLCMKWLPVTHSAKSLLKERKSCYTVVDKG